MDVHNIASTHSDVAFCMQMYIVFIIQYILPRHRQWLFSGDSSMYDVTAAVLHSIHVALIQFGALSIIDGGKSTDRLLTVLCSGGMELWWEEYRLVC